MDKQTYIVNLKNNAEILRDFVDKMGPDEIHNRIKDYWTIYQHVVHLAESQKVLLHRMNLFLSEARPVIKPYAPDGDDSADNKPIGYHLDEFERFRNQQIVVIKNAGEEVWMKTGEHPEFKKYSFDILIRHALMHDGFHMWRMEELWIKKDDLILDLESN